MPEMSSQKTLKRRSNSSLELRNRLKKNLIIPEVSPEVPVSKYIYLGNSIFYAAVKSCANRNLTTAYVDLFRFQLLVLEKLEQHPGYHAYMESNVDVRNWLNSAKRSAMEHIEYIVGHLDAEEDRRIESMEYDLIDEFDNDEEDEPSSVSNEVIKKEVEEDISEGIVDSGSDYKSSWQYLNLPEDDTCQHSESSKTKLEVPAISFDGSTSVATQKECMGGIGDVTVGTSTIEMNSGVSFVAHLTKADFDILQFIISYKGYVHTWCLSYRSYI